MAYRRIKVGSILKAKDASQADYIKIDNDIVLKKGEFLSLESKKSKMETLERNIADGKVSGELADKIMEGIEKMPTFVRFEIIKIIKD